MRKSGNIILELKNNFAWGIKLLLFSERAVGGSSNVGTSMIHCTIVHIPFHVGHTVSIVVNQTPLFPSPHAQLSLRIAKKILNALFLRVSFLQKKINLLGQLT